MAGTVNEAVKLARALSEAKRQARGLSQAVNGVTFRPGSTPAAAQKPAQGVALSLDQQFQQRARSLDL